MYLYEARKSINTKNKYFSNKEKGNLHNIIQKCGQAHHVIPKELKNYCDEHFTRGYGPFEELTVNVPSHIGSHPGYTAAVETALSHCNSDNVESFALNLAQYLSSLSPTEKLDDITFSDIQSLIPKDNENDSISSAGRLRRPVSRWDPSPIENPRNPKVNGMTLRNREAHRRNPWL